MSTTPISLLAVIGATAITPGPNNMIVMTLAARNGLRAASQALIGVLLGTLLLLVIANFAFALVATREALITVVVAAVGSAYFSWLGLKLIIAQPDAAECRQPLPSSALGLVGFQLVNPKAWMLAMTVAATTGAIGRFWMAASATLLISGLCLCIWMFSGVFVARTLHAPGAIRVFEMTIGSVLMITGLILAHDVWSARA